MTVNLLGFHLDLRSKKYLRRTQLSDCYTCASVVPREISSRSSLVIGTICKLHMITQPATLLSLWSVSIDPPRLSSTHHGFDSLSTDIFSGEFTPQRHRVTAGRFRFASLDGSPRVSCLSLPHMTLDWTRPRGISAMAERWMLPPGTRLTVMSPPALQVTSFCLMRYL